MVRVCIDMYKPLHEIVEAEKDGNRSAVVINHRTVHSVMMQLVLLVKLKVI